MSTWSHFLQHLHWSNHMQLVYILHSQLPSDTWSMYLNIIAKHKDKVKELLVPKMQDTPNRCKKLTTCKDSTKHAFKTCRSLLRPPIETYETHAHIPQRLPPLNCRYITLVPNTVAMAPIHFIHNIDMTTMWEVITLHYNFILFFIFIKAQTAQPKYTTSIPEKNLAKRRKKLHHPL